MEALPKEWIGALKQEKSLKTKAKIQNVFCILLENKTALHFNENFNAKKDIQGINSFEISKTICTEILGTTFW